MLTILPGNSCKLQRIMQFLFECVLSICKQIRSVLDTADKMVSGGRNKSVASCRISYIQQAQRSIFFLFFFFNVEVQPLCLCILCTKTGWNLWSVREWRAVGIECLLGGRSSGERRLREKSTPDGRLFLYTTHRQRALYDCQQAIHCPSQHSCLSSSPLSRRCYPPALVSIRTSVWILFLLISAPTRIVKLCRSK